MILLLLTANIHYSSQIKKQLNKKISFNNKQIKLNDDCIDTANGGVLITEGTDAPGCAQAYVNLYKKLPVGADAAAEVTAEVTAGVAAYNAACLATGCAETCHDLLFPDGNSVTYDAAFKASFKEVCIPPGAAALPIDVCTKGDDTKVTGLKDDDDCIKSYEKLLEVLPDPTNSRNKSRKLLDGEEEAFADFSSKCLNTICSKDACYSAIIKTAPTVFDSVLKDKISKNCNPKTEDSQSGEDSQGGEDPQGNGDSGIVFSKCNHFLLLFGLFLINFNFWQ
jgi:hypothetical protein